MEQNRDQTTGNTTRIGHENFCRYSFSSARRVRFHGKRTEREKIYFRIKDAGLTSEEIAEGFGWKSNLR